jgi:hypothetical protein
MDQVNLAAKLATLGELLIEPSGTPNTGDAATAVPRRTV